MITEILKYVGLLVTAAGGGAGITKLFMVGIDKKKYNADLFRAGLDSASVVNEKVQSQIMSLIDPYLEQSAFLRTELKTSHEEIASLRLEIASLRLEIAALRALKA